MLGISSLFILSLGTHVQSPICPVFETSLYPVIHRFRIVIHVFPVGCRIVRPVRRSLSCIIFPRHQQRLIYRLRGCHVYEISLVIRQSRPRTKPPPHTFNARPIVLIPIKHSTHRKLERQVLRQPGITRQVQQYTSLAIFLQVTIFIIIRSRERVIQLLRTSPQRHVILLTHHPLEHILVQIIFPHLPVS